MSLFGGGVPHCKRCGCELDGDEEACPRCQFNPRLKGLRVSMGFFMLFVLSITAMALLLPVWTAPGPYLLDLALISFVLSVVIFFISFLATPYRFGSVFSRL